MKVTIFNGNPNGSRAEFDGYLSSLAVELRKRNHEVEVIALRDLNLRRCTGCFNCWVKTPGLCVQKDDGGLLCRRMLESDLLVHASPLVMGFVSPLIRRASERMMPLILPYFQVVDGELRHRLRYDHYPKYGLLMEEEPDTDEQDIALMTEFYTQIALEIHCDLQFVESTRHSVAEVADAFDGI